MTTPIVDSELDVASWLEKHAYKVSELGFGSLYRVKCAACGNPKCTRILVRYDLHKNLLFRDCTKIVEREFDTIREIKPYVNVG